MWGWARATLNVLSMYWFCHILQVKLHYCTKARSKRITWTHFRAHWNQCCTTAFYEETLDHIPELPVRTTSRLSNVTIINEQSVLSGLLSLNCNKTPGPNKIHLCLLKNFATSLCKSIHNLFDQSLYTGELPTDWKNANVTPVHKKGSRS